MKKLLDDKKKSIAVAFTEHFDTSTTFYLLINNDHFHSYVHSIYISELEMKNKTECSTSASYLDILLK
jgi:hypothetical protein